ncbi:hypothetical protein [Macrococcus bovicus]|uniref:Uncharacterized protein n=1 Tax=Macrococcus bovicus TaxID=69968 RepID=A0A4R6C2W4_9STAP|nr:hypothetical protein [Macrococcus bovicus]TDM15710.1 hypothetical protein ERX55_02040 [Macrococcus bovicus]
MSVMRNIKLADELITKTFGVDGNVVRLLKFQVDKTKVLFVIERGSITAQFDLREGKVIHKIDGDNVPFETQNILYDQAQYIRRQLFKDEDDDQMTMDDYEDDIIDADFREVNDEEQLTLEGSETLMIETTDETLDNLSEEDVDIEDEESDNIEIVEQEEDFKVGDKVVLKTDEGENYFADTVIKVTSVSIYVGIAGTGIKAVGTVRINRDTMMDSDEKYKLLKTEEGEQND